MEVVYMTIKKQYLVFYQIVTKQILYIKTIREVVICLEEVF